MRDIITNKYNLKEEDMTEVVQRVKILLVNSGNEILLGYSHNNYQFPGGHVEENEASNWVVSVVLGCLMRDFQNGTFITFDFRIHVLQSHEGIEHVHNQLELIRNERIVVDEVLLVSVLAITGRKIELGIKGRRLLVIEFSELDDGIRILVQDTLLRDVLGICSLKGNTGFESAKNLSVVVACFSNVGSAKDFC